MESLRSCVLAAYSASSASPFMKDFLSALAILLTSLFSSSHLLVSLSFSHCDLVALIFCLVSFLSEIFVQVSCFIHSFLFFVLYPRTFTPALSIPSFSLSCIPGLSLLLHPFLPFLCLVSQDFHSCFIHSFLFFVLYPRTFIPASSIPSFSLSCIPGLSLLLHPFLPFLCLVSQDFHSCFIHSFLFFVLYPRTFTPASSIPSFSLSCIPGLSLLLHPFLPFLCLVSQDFHSCFIHSFLFFVLYPRTFTPASSIPSFSLSCIPGLSLLFHPFLPFLCLVSQDFHSCFIHSFLFFVLYPRTFTPVSSIPSFSLSCVPGLSLLLHRLLD